MLVIHNGKCPRETVYSRGHLFFQVLSPNTNPESSTPNNTQYLVVPGDPRSELKVSAVSEIKFDNPNKYAIVYHIMNIKKKSYLIQVRHYQSGQSQYGSDGIGKITGDYGKFDLVKTIKRPLWAEQIGNFSPFFCSYKGKRTLIHSDEGDVSDPFRREESYANSFFITI